MENKQDTQIVPVAADFTSDELARIVGIAERMGIAWSCSFGGMNRWHCRLRLRWPGRADTGITVSRFDAPANGPELIDGLCWGALCAAGFSGSMEGAYSLTKWCATHDLDHRSITARSMYLEARKTARKLLRFLGEDEYRVLWIAGLSALPRMLERKAKQAEQARANALRAIHSQ
jgi:hypothetical protein